MRIRQVTNFVREADKLIEVLTPYLAMQEEDFRRHLKGLATNPRALLEQVNELRKAKKAFEDLEI